MIIIFNKKSLLLLYLLCEIDDVFIIEVASKSSRIHNHIQFTNSKETRWLDLSSSIARDTSWTLYAVRFIYIFSIHVFARYGRFIWPRFSYHLFQPADCSSSSIDKSNEEDDDDNVNDGNVSSTELRDIVKDGNVLLNKTTAVQNEIEKFQASERAAAQAYDQVMILRSFHMLYKQYKQ